MNQKEIRKYDLIVEIGKTHPADVTVVTLLRELASIDFACAFEVWEFMLGKHSATLASTEISDNIEGKALEMFLKYSEARTKQLLFDSPTLMKLVYSGASTSAQGENLRLLTGLILASKIELSDEILKLVAANKNTNLDFGDRMRVILDDVFETYCAKHDTRVPNLNRKQTMMLLEHCLKTKGTIKPVLVQRIKELG